MTDKEKRALWLGVGIAVAGAAATAAAVYYYKKKKTESPLLETAPLLEMNEEDCGEVVFNCEENPAIDFDAALDIAVKAASKKFGNDPFVVSASDKKAIYETICGEKRACYSFGADDSSFLGGTPRGFLLVDAQTGEVFESENGEIQKID